LIPGLEPMRRAFRDVPTCRVATLDVTGAPYLAARWFVWREDGLYVSTPREDATWSNAARDPRVSVVIDRGADWLELAGVRVNGAAELLPAEHPDVRGAMSTWHEKYRSFVGGGGFERLARDVPALGFLRIDPTSVDAWDHRLG
jgi:pyridoxamine 5'-phosphate oxidase-like protein